MKEIIKQIEYRANTICSANYQNLNVVFSIVSKQCKDTYLLLYSLYATLRVKESMVYERIMGSAWE